MIDSPASVHVPVLPTDVMASLEVAPGKVIVDGTFGGGGHARMLAAALGSSGTLIGFDRDPGAIARFGSRFMDELAQWPENQRPTVELICDSYHRLPFHLQRLGIEAVDGVLLDLGLSSDQLNDQQRGFSFQTEGELDLRFDPTSGQSAAELLMELPEKEIADLIYRYGEERCSRRIARQIVARRKARRPVRTVTDLAELVRRCVRRSKNHRIDPATRTFQALRIAVNQELRIVEQSLQDFPASIIQGGRFAVISFHSLEDRLAKHAFREDPRLETITRKPIVASDHESQENPRARSAKLRVAKRITPPPGPTPPFGGSL